MNQSSTFLSALAESLARTGAYNKNDQVPPAVILWPDKERQWEPLLPRLRTMLPLLTFDPVRFEPHEQRGPAYYLRCLLAGTLPIEAGAHADPPPTTLPVIYLPGVSKAELRAVDECPRALQPLAELQYRGVWWAQKNGKDWTLAAFLQAKEGGLGIEVVGDIATRDALRQSLVVLADIPLAELSTHAPLKSDYLYALLQPDDARSLLSWIDHAETFRAGLSAEAWIAFCGVSRQKYGINPEKDGPITAAEKLGLQQGAWKAVWERYLEAPQAYPDLPARLRSAGAAVQLSLFDKSESWPQDNESEENALRKDLQELGALSYTDACLRIAALEGQHGKRRTWVWAKLGQAPLALALGHLALAAKGMQSPVGGIDLEAVTAKYTAHGWQVDAEILRSLAQVELMEDSKAVRTAVRAVYRTWLETAAVSFQKVLAGRSDLSALAAPAPKPENGTCVLFCDGLRYDLARQLMADIELLGLSCHLAHRLAPLPPITATAKPTAVQTKGGLSGKGSNSFDPLLPGNKSLLTAEAYRKLLAAEGGQILNEDEYGDPSGWAWTELGQIDAYGHEHSSNLPGHIESELLALEKRVFALLEAGWKQVRLVTDHGWLLLPGGLPKVQLPEHLTVLRKGRCARLKDGAQTDFQTLPWFWDADVWVAYAPGIACFEAGKEYEHGGLSPQECLVPVLEVQRSQNTATLHVEMNDVTWKGLRCTVHISGSMPSLLVDLRSKAGDAGSSLLAKAKAPDITGVISLLVEDADRLGDAAHLVVLNDSGQIVAQQHVTIGG